MCGLHQDCLPYWKGMWIVIFKLNVRINRKNFTVILILLLWNFHEGDSEWDSIPQEMLQVHSWRLYYKPIQLHCTWRKTLLQASPYPTLQRERKLQPARKRPRPTQRRETTDSRRNCCWIIIISTHLNKSSASCLYIHILYMLLHLLEGFCSPTPLDQGWWFFQKIWCSINGYGLLLGFFLVRLSEMKIDWYTNFVSEFAWDMNLYSYVPSYEKNMFK